MTSDVDMAGDSRGAVPTRLTDNQIDEYLALLEIGAPPLLACQRLGIKFDLVESTLVADPEFVEQVEQVKRLLADNVAAALYKKALSGSVYAQLHYLRQCRPKPLDVSESYKEMSTDELDDLFYHVTKSRYSDRWAKERDAAQPSNDAGPPPAVDD